MSLPVLRLNDGYSHTSPNLAPDVKRLQEALNKNGFKLASDGAFGRGTEQAVIEFQKKKKLGADGIVGAVTWAQLLNQAPVTTRGLSTSVAAGEGAGLLRQSEIAEAWRSTIEAAAKAHKIAPSVVLGIGSRESGWGLHLKPTGPGGTGDFHPRVAPGKFRTGGLPPEGGFGRGLMQIDFDAHLFARTGDWSDPEKNIEYGCTVLAGNLVFLAKRTDLKSNDLLRAALAAYNCGAGNVLKALKALENVDYFTTGRDYSADVLNRAGFFQRNGWH